MRVSRGEFAFGAGVITLASILLFLAVGRLSAPVLRPDATVATVVQALPAQAPPVAQTHPRPVALPPRRLATVGRTAHPVKREVAAPKQRPKPRVLAKAVPKTVHAKTSASRVSAEHAIVAKVLPPVVVAFRARTTVALVAKPLAVRVTPKRVKRVRPAGAPVVVDVTVRQPSAAAAKSEATPEPPIGYDEQPALLRANVPSVSATGAP